MCGSGYALPGTALFLRGSAPIAPGSMRKRLPGATLWLVPPNSLGQSPIKIPQLPEGPQPLPHIGRHSRKEQSLIICVDANETSSWHPRKTASVVAVCVTIHETSSWHFSTSTSRHRSTPSWTRNNQRWRSIQRAGSSLEAVGDGTAKSGSYQPRATGSDQRRSKRADVVESARCLSAAAEGDEHIGLGHTAWGRGEDSSS